MGTYNVPYINYNQPAQYMTDVNGRPYVQLPSGQVVPLTATTTASPTVELPVEKRDMPVVGYRGWTWITQFRIGYGQKGTLVSTGVKAYWKSASETARCTNGIAHLSPDPNCSCGLYVMATMDELDSHFSFNDAMIVGAVVGWGRVVQHGTQGWRAQHCRILGLLDCKFSDAQLKATRDAAKEYRLPILEREGMERYVREWGDPFADPLPALPADTK